MKVDVAINVYGKPAQTAVTLLSLLEHCSKHIGMIHLTMEKKQPVSTDLGPLLRSLGDRVLVYRPRFWFDVRPQRSRWLMRWKPYRQSLRYQHAWETSDKQFLFVTHNDVLYSDDVIGALLDRIPGHVAAGPVGQCWNCPASSAGKCAPDRFSTFRPSYEEWRTLAARYPGPRVAHYTRVVDPIAPWPLPECRVNEWTALIDLQLARPLTMPRGRAIPLGALYGLDIGTQWFHDVLHEGARVRHVDVAPYATHAWASDTGGGHAALSDPAVYDLEEERARHVLREQYNWPGSSAL